MPYQVEYNDALERFHDDDAKALAGMGKYHVISGGAITWSTSNMQITVGAAVIKHSGNRLTPAQQTVTPTAPVSGFKWVLFGWDNTGTLQLVQGTAAANTDADPALKPALGDLVYAGAALIQANLTIINNATLKLDKRHPEPAIDFRDVRGTVTNPMSADVTLTLTSKPTVVVKPNASWLSVILPDATTLTVGDSYTIVNDADMETELSRSVIIRANGGGFLGGLLPGHDVTVILTNNGTAAGTWRFAGPQPAVSTATPYMPIPAVVQYVPGPQGVDNTVGGTSAEIGFAFDMLDATRGVLVIHTTKGGVEDIWARGFAINTTTGVITFGTAVVVETTDANIGNDERLVVCAIDANTAMVGWDDSAVHMDGAVINFSPGSTTISSVGAAQLLVTSGASPVYGLDAILLDTNKVVLAIAIPTTTTYLVCVDRSGDTLTAGTPLAASGVGTYARLMKIDATHFLLADRLSGNVNIRICSVSGTTITALNNFNITGAVGSDTPVGLFQVSSLNYVCLWLDSGQLMATHFTANAGLTTLTQGNTFQAYAGQFKSISSATPWPYAVEAPAGVYHTLLRNNSSADFFHARMLHTGGNNFDRAAGKFFHEELYATRSFWRATDPTQAIASSFPLHDDVDLHFTTATQMIAHTVNDNVILLAYASLDPQTPQNIALVPYRIG